MGWKQLELQKEKQLELQKEKQLELQKEKQLEWWCSPSSSSRGTS